MMPKLDKQVGTSSTAVLLLLWTVLHSCLPWCRSHTAREGITLYRTLQDCHKNTLSQFCVYHLAEMMRTAVDTHQRDSF